MARQRSSYAHMYRYACYGNMEMYSKPHMPNANIDPNLSYQNACGPYANQSNQTLPTKKRVNKTLSRSAPQIPPQPRNRRRVNDLVEQRCAPYQQRETSHLQPFERFPAEAERDEPYEERAAGVDCAARCGGDLACYREAEEVETTARERLLAW